MTSSTPSSHTPPPGADQRDAHSARVWNYWLGGKDNYPVDHDAGDPFRCHLAQDR